MASSGGDGFWSVVGKTSRGSADDLLSLGRGGGGGGGGKVGYAEDVGFLVTCPKLRNIRNTVLEAQRILKHFSCVQEKKKVETETEPPQVSHEIARNRQRNTMYGPPLHNLCFFIQPAPMQSRSYFDKLTNFFPSATPTRGRNAEVMRVVLFGSLRSLNTSFGAMRRSWSTPEAARRTPLVCCRGSWPRRPRPRRGAL